MTKKLIEKEIELIEKNGQSRVVRVQKHERQRENTTINRNRGIIGESIETMLERIREGEGEDGISDRDLVYNDGESSSVNPITNIRSDKMELMLEQKQGEYEHRHRTVKLDVTKDKEKETKEEPKTDSETAENP